MRSPYRGKANDSPESGAGGGLRWVERLVCVGGEGSSAEECGLYSNNEVSEIGVGFASTWCNMGI